MDYWRSEVTQIGRTLDEVGWIVEDWDRACRVAREADAEIEALRQLVRDFVEAAGPVIDQVPLSMCRPEEWQYRAKLAMARCRLTEAGPE